MSIVRLNEERYGLPPNADGGWSYLVTIYCQDGGERVRYATILTLRAIAGMSFQAIAHQLHISNAGSAHRLYQRAIQDFREWAGHPRFTSEELRAILAGEASPYPACARVRELAQRVTPI